MGASTGQYVWARGVRTGLNVQVNFRDLSLRPGKLFPAHKFSCLSCLAGALLYQLTHLVSNAAHRNKSHVSPSRTGFPCLLRNSQPPWMGSSSPRVRPLRCQRSYPRLPIATKGCRGGHRRFVVLFNTRYFLAPRPLTPTPGRHQCGNAPCVRDRRYGNTDRQHKHRNDVRPTARGSVQLACEWDRHSVLLMVD